MTFLETYALYFFIGGVLIYAYHIFDSGQKSKLDGSIVESLNNIAQELDAGNSIETSIMTISQDKSNPSAKYFGKLIEETRKGHSFQESLEIVSKNSDSRTFSYVCDIILLAQKSKGNISSSLKELSQNLWEIDHLQESVNSKAGAPLSTLKMLGIIIIPLLYYMMASVLSSDTLVIAITTPFKVYFVGTALAMSFADYFLFSDYKEGLYILPFTITYMILVFVKLGPMIGGFFGA